MKNDQLQEFKYICFELVNSKSKQEFENRFEKLVHRPDAAALKHTYTKIKWVMNVQEMESIDFDKFERLYDDTKNDSERDVLDKMIAVETMFFTKVASIFAIVPLITVFGILCFDHFYNFEPKWIFAVCLVVYPFVWYQAHKFTTQLIFLTMPKFESENDVKHMPKKDWNTFGKIRYAFVGDLGSVFYFAIFIAICVTLKFLHKINFDSPNEFFLTLLIAFSIHVIRYLIVSAYIRIFESKKALSNENN
jgi:hypothetical protein